MRRLILAFAALATATPALADPAACEITRSTLTAAHDGHLKTHEAGRVFIDGHPDGFLCAPAFLPLMQNEVAAIEIEKKSVEMVIVACAGEHIVDRMKSYMLTVDSQLTAAHTSLETVESVCRKKS